MSTGHDRIRSYQRVFAPERRIHQVEGRSLPVPGGVPLRGLAWAAGALAAVVALAAAPLATSLLAAGTAGIAGRLLGGREAAAAAAACALAGTMLLGLALGLLDWPLRLIVLPGAIGTLATQASPDGRRAERFAAAWLALRLLPGRRSLGRALPLGGVPLRLRGEVWVAPDERGPDLRRARLRGPARVRFGLPVRVCRAALRGGHAVVRSDSRRGAVGRVELGEGATLEVRP